MGLWYSDGPIIQVPGQNVAGNQGLPKLRQIKDTLQGENDYINSVVAMTPAEDPEFIMYVTVQQTEVKFSATSWEELVNPILEDAVALKDELHLTSEAPTLDGVTKETTYKIPFSRNSL